MTKQIRSIGEPVEQKWYQRTATKIVGWSLLAASVAGLVVSGLYHRIKYDSSAEVLSQLKTLKHIQDTRAVNADADIQTIKDNMALMMKLNDVRFPSRMHVYQPGENPWNVAKAYLEQDGAANPSDKKVLKATNALGARNGKDAISRESDDEIKNKVPVKRWKNLKRNPNFARAGDPADISDLIPNELARFKAKKAAADAEKALAITAINKAESDREKAKDRSAGLSELIKGQKTKVAGQSDGSLPLAGAGLLTAAGLIGAWYSRRRKYTIENVVAKLTAKPQVLDGRNSSRYAETIAREYNAGTFNSNRLMSGYTPETTRDALAARLYSAIKVADQVRKDTYMSVKDIAKLTGLSEYKVEKLGKEKGASRALIRAELTEKRRSDAHLYDGISRSKSEIAEKLGVSINTVRKYLRPRDKL